jgi:hypothetical protein
MVSSVQASDSSDNISYKTPQEKQKRFELIFEIDVLSCYISMLQQNGSLQSQLSKLKNGLESGQSTDQLASNLNQLISQINDQIVPGKPPFPFFSFSNEGSQVQALRNFTLSVQKFINTAAERGQMNWNDEQKLFGELSSLVNNMGQMTPEQAFEKLNGIIEESNQHLSHNYQLPTIPFMQGEKL